MKATSPLHRDTELWVAEFLSSTWTQWNYFLGLRLCVLFQVYEILARTVYGKRKRAEVGVDRLVNEGVYTAAFPLHEVRLLFICSLICPKTCRCFVPTNIIFFCPLRAPSSFQSMKFILTSWIRGRFFTTTGPAGANGTSINLWTTSESTLERRLHSTLPGWVIINRTS